MESMSINLPVNAQVSGMKQWGDRYQMSADPDTVTAPPTKCTSHQSSIGLDATICPRNPFQQPKSWLWTYPSLFIS